MKIVTIAKIIGFFGFAVIGVYWMSSPIFAVEDLSARIDQSLEAASQASGAALSPLTDDAAFLRRASLDLIGRIPTVGEVREFLETPGVHPSDPKNANVLERRRRKVQELMAQPAYAQRAALVWRRNWAPQTDAEGMEHVAAELEEWLAGRFARREPMDKVVRDLLCASARTPTGGRPAGDASSGFLIANELNPEQLAGSASRAFLGLNLACAQCHNHPFAPWTRDQFWEFAAFFGKPDSKRPAPRPETTVGETARRVFAQPPDGAVLTWPAHIQENTDRRVLANWLTAPNNPWFAKQMVNQLWANLFGVGLVESFDDPATDNPPANRALLELLAREFANSNFNLNQLTMAVVMTKAYQRQSAPLSGSEGTQRLFVSTHVRILSGEQLYDSLRTAAGMSVPRDDLEIERMRRERLRFADRFAVAQATSEGRSLLQALALMNGDLISEVTSADRSPVLVASGSPLFSMEERVQMLFMATLGRRATDNELTSMLTHASGKGGNGESARALADIFWALINGSEFQTNH